VKFFPETKLEKTDILKTANMKPKEREGHT